jgi:hypothetical protein
MPVLPNLDAAGIETGATERLTERVLKNKQIIKKI